MDAHSYLYHHRRYPRFGRIGWNPWCYVSVQTMQLFYSRGCRTFQTACIPHPCHIDIRCLSTFNLCEWAYGCTLTPLPPQTFSQIRKSWAIWVSKPWHFTLVEAIETFKLHPTSMSHTSCLSTFNYCGWAHRYTLTPLQPQTFSQIWENWLKS
jgi:hypothetical protein